MFEAPWQTLDVPKCNILSYLFPPDAGLSKEPKWLNADDPSESISPAQMVTLIKRFATGLSNLGVKEKEVVMIFSPNNLYVPLVYLATAGSKRCFTGANPGYTTAEVAMQIASVRPAILLVHESLIETGFAAAEKTGLAHGNIYVFGNKHGQRNEQTTMECKDWWSILASEEDSASWQWDPLNGESATTTIAVINFSSGTTGVPKGVCITHYNLVANTEQCKYNHFSNPSVLPDHGEPERWLAFLPLYHAYSQLFTINIACKIPTKVYIMPKFVFESFLQHIQRHKITSLHVVPPVVVMLAKRPEASKYNLSSIKYVLCGAAPLYEDLQNHVMKRFGFVICQGMGLSETTASAFISPGYREDSEGSIGNLIPNTAARLVDEDGSDILGEGMPGELYLKGPQIMLAYWQNEKATQDTMTADGWLKTGDIAVTRGGKWWIVDRKKELIKVNGLQVAPAELEAVLLEHPQVADAAVTGITVHDQEMPRAYVVLQEGTANGKNVTAHDIQRFVAERVAKHKALKGGVKFVSAVPKLASGKIVRKELRRWAADDVQDVERLVMSKL